MPENDSATIITVALPTCNGARHLPETLRGLVAQGGNSPIVVSDDRSDDDTIAIIQRQLGDRAKITINSERLGLAGNWNQCVALSRTPFVAILHQDEVWQPGHLAAHGEAFAADDSLGLVASAVHTIDELSEPISPRVIEEGGLGPQAKIFAPGQAVSLMTSHNPLRCSAVTIAKAAHRVVGGFDPSYRYVVDWDFWLRVASRFSIGWRSRATVNVRWHQQSETHRFATGTADLDETVRLLEHLFSVRKVKLAERWSAHRHLARAFLNRAHVALRAGNARLSRESLGRAIRRHPAILGKIAVDPRLAVQMAAVTVAPGWASRTFGPKPTS